MNTWRLEWLRLVRTPRALALAAVYLFFGLTEPVLTKYASQIFSHVTSGAQITFPTPTPAAGLSSYVSQASQTGMIVVVVIAAGAFTFDARHGLATFLRTRARSMWQLLIPRFAVNTAAAAVAYLLGTLAAWYETSLLIGPVPAAATFGGLLCGAVYLAFAIAVAAVAASVVRGTLGTVGLSLVVLLLLPIVGLAKAVHDWLPTTLATAPADLLTGAHDLVHYLPAMAISAAVTAALLALAVTRLSAREV